MRIVIHIKYTKKSPVWGHMLYDAYYIFYDL